MKGLLRYPGIKTISLEWSLYRERENKVTMEIGAIGGQLPLLDVGALPLMGGWGQELGEAWLPSLPGSGLRGSEPSAPLFHQPGHEIHAPSPLVVRTH